MAAHRCATMPVGCCPARAPRAVDPMAHGALRAELPAGVARLHLPARSTRSPVRYSLASVADTAAITGGAVSPEAREMR